MCINMEFCGECQEAGEHPSVKAFIELETNETPTVGDLSVRYTAQQLRNENIRAAVDRGDPLIYDLPEIGHMVHPSNKAVQWPASHIGQFNRYSKASKRDRYEEFRALAANYGINLEPGASCRNRTRRNRIRFAHDKYRKEMSILLFAFQYGYDVELLSRAAHREKPSSPIMTPLVANDAFAQAEDVLEEQRLAA